MVDFGLMTDVWGKSKGKTSKGKLSFTGKKSVIFPFPSQGKHRKISRISLTGKKSVIFENFRGKKTYIIFNNIVFSLSLRSRGKERRR